MNKIVYIAHPISGDIEGNLKDIIRILRVINTNNHPKRYEKHLPFEFKNVIPQAPYYHDIIALYDNNALERKRGIDNYIAMIKSGVYDELWLTGDRISFGMQEEINLFKLLGKPILNYLGRI